MKYESVNELILTGWLPVVEGGCGDVGKRAASRVRGASSVVATSEGAKASEAVGGGGGRFGAKARSARATEGLGWGRGAGCGEVRERAGHALGVGAEGEIEPR